MSDLVLYTNPMSRGRIARWMLEEVGAPYAVEILDYASTMQGEAYRAINPMMKVPAIVHGERVVTECAAICAYLADAFPDAGLAPALHDRADYYRWLFFAAGPLEAAITDKALGVEPTEQQTRMAGYGTLDRTLSALEQLLAGRAYVTGDRFSAADVYVGSHLMWGMQFRGIRPRDVFEAYAERLGARDAYRRAAALDDAAMPAPQPA